MRAAAAALVYLGYVLYADLEVRRLSGRSKTGDAVVEKSSLRKSEANNIIT